MCDKTVNLTFILANLGTKIIYLNLRHENILNYAIGFSKKFKLVKLKNGKQALLEMGNIDSRKKEF